MTSKQTLIADIEVYRDYFLLGLMNAETKNVRQFEMWPLGDGSAEHGFEEERKLDIQSITNIFQRYRIITFNGNHYDLPLITAALRGADCTLVKELSDKIIQQNIKPWNLGIGDPIRCDHIDIFEVAPGMASLKIYGGRLHCPKLQDLPIDEAASISPADRERLKTYNVNDLQTTFALFDHLKPQIELREKMTEVYGVDLRSKSDAQIAEAVIVKHVGNALGETVKRPEVKSGTRFAYTPPRFITFTTEPLRDLLEQIKRLQFLVPDGGAVKMPVELEKASIRVGAGVYRLGIGGLHSSEQTISHYSDDETILVDRDVASYYPTIILRAGIAPAHMGQAFTRCYADLLEQRLTAKRAGNKVGSDTLKIVLNGTFGKLGSMWSKLYAPHLLIQTTMTGQLSLLMLIEALEEAKIPVVSANTDGLTIKCLRAESESMNHIVAEWEKATGFETEETLYRQVHSRDVNNYIALKADGGVKLKGAYAPAGLMKNPTNSICILAAIAFLCERTPIEETVLGCSDARLLVTIRQVKGGAIDQQGEYLGKAVRWYYARGVEGPIRYKVNNYIVARSEGARPLMELPEALPDDVDYDWYIAETKSLLADMGVDPVAYQVGDLI